MWLSPFHSPSESISDYEVLWAWQLKTFPHLLTSLVAQNLHTVQEAQFWSLGWEDPRGKELSTNSSTLSWRIPWTEEPGRLQSMGSQRVGHDCVTFSPPWDNFYVTEGHLFHEEVSHKLFCDSYQHAITYCLLELKGEKMMARLPCAHDY